MPARPHLPIALALATLAAATCAPSASAAWSAPQAIAGAGASNVHAAGNRHGSQAFVWKITSGRFLRLPAQTGFASHVRARIRLPDGRMGRAQTISSTREIVANPQIGVQESGDAVAVWAQAGRRIRIMAAFRPRGRTFGTPVEIGRSTALIGSRPQLAVGRFGDAVIAWNRGRSIAVVRDAGNSQCAPQRHFACWKGPFSLRDGSDHTVAIGPLGSAYVAWAAHLRGADALRTRMRMIVIRRSGLSAGEVAISRAAHQNASQPSIAVHPDGVADVAWRASIPAGGEQNEAAPILAAASDPREVVAGPQVVSAVPGERPVVGVNRAGEAILAWTSVSSTPQNPDGLTVQLAVRAPGAGAFGAPAAIVPPGLAASAPSLVVDAAGSAHVAYTTVPAIDPFPAGPGALSHVRPAGGALGPPNALPPNFSGLRLVAAGAKVTAVSPGGVGGTLVSDWTS